MEGKESILNKCVNLLTRKNKFDEKVRDLKKEYPDTYISRRFMEEIKGKIFYYDENFYIPKRIVIDKLSGEDTEQPLIECEKLGLFSWSNMTMNKIPKIKFKDFFEVNQENLKTISDNLLGLYSRTIVDLEHDINERLNKTKDD